MKQTITFPRSSPKAFNKENFPANSWFYMRGGALYLVLRWEDRTATVLRFTNDSTEESCFYVDCGLDYHQVDVEIRASHPSQ